MQQRKLTPISSFTLICAYLVIIFPLRSCLKESQRSDEYMKKLGSYPDSPKVTVSGSSATIFKRPRENNREMLGYLKMDIRYDSLVNEMKRTKMGSNGFVYISFRYKHWFYFYDKSTPNKFRGAWLHTHFIQPEEKGIYSYIRHLKNDEEANFPTFYNSQK